MSVIENIMNIPAEHEKNVFGSFDGNIKKKDGRFETMKTGADHGYGMKNVERVLEKYEGCVQYEHNEYMFYAKCMIYVKENVLV